MMNIRDEQVTNTTIPAKPIPDRTITSPPGSAVQDEGGFHTLFQWESRRPRMTIRVAFFGGLAGAIFFVGLAAAILSGHFWEVFLIDLGICSLVSSLSSSKAQAIFAGVQGSVFLLGLAVLAWTGWWWPGILVVLGIAAVLGIGSGLLALWPVAKPSRAVDQYYTALSNQDYARAYGLLDTSLAASLPLEEFTAMARGQDTAEGTVSRYSIAPELAVTTTPLPAEPLPRVTFTRHPAQHLLVMVERAQGPSYLAHLQVRRVGKAWTITAFDRI